MFWKRSNNHEKFEHQLQIQRKLQSQSAEVDPLPLISSQLKEVISNYIENQEKDDIKL